ncbi:hypothetical protein VNI00_017839 [Paramarasmius palmivorus]|uniref:Uncharacterized protein n=1 Tax=Paramarasmius palmivorus TaxID=297713 RepID=A0AAW0B4F5_9AGAR
MLAVGLLNLFGICRVAVGLVIFLALKLLHLVLDIPHSVRPVIEDLINKFNPINANVHGLYSVPLPENDTYLSLNYHTTLLSVMVRSQQEIFIHPSNQSPLSLYTRAYETLTKQSYTAPFSCEKTIVEYAKLKGINLSFSSLIALAYRFNKETMENYHTLPPVIPPGTSGTIEHAPNAGERAEVIRDLQQIALSTDEPSSTAIAHLIQLVQAAMSRDMIQHSNFPRTQIDYVPLEDLGAVPSKYSRHSLSSPITREMMKIVKSITTICDVLAKYLTTLGFGSSNLVTEFNRETRERIAHRLHAKRIDAFMLETPYGNDFCGPVPHNPYIQPFEYCFLLPATYFLDIIDSLPYADKDRSFRSVTGQLRSVIEHTMVPLHYDIRTLRAAFHPTADAWKHEDAYHLDRVL